MRSDEIRRRFLQYFARQGHTVVASASLVPDDPTLLFNNAGMVQFKDVFLGLESRSYRRAASAQKCMRVSGKHNDLENVGPSPRHHTFFEMLGNFSFGDYFKREAIGYAWEFMTGEMGVDPERLVLTVHVDDDEALRAWTVDVGVRAERVLRMGDKTNFWMMADEGPCGPTSEVHYDVGPEHCTCGRADCSVALDNDCGRWLEVWNLVFMQHDQLADGTRRPLPSTGVDTGMGLERMAAIMQGTAGNYRTDLFQPLMDHVQRAAGHDDERRRAQRVGYRVLADHGRAMTFLAADGVLPGNEGRAYVLRLIMRRAMRYARLIELGAPVLGPLTEAVVRTMGDAYPELRERAAWVREVVDEEEARFERTLESGLAILDAVVADVRRAGGTCIPGDEVFRLYDTFGFPPDLTRVVAEEHGLGVDRAGFDEAMTTQRARARAGTGFGVGGAADYYRRLALPETVFTGYDGTEADARVLALRVGEQAVAAAGPTTEAEVVLERTPFYAEAGGQVGDTGWLRADGLEARVLETRSPVPGITVHHAALERGELRVGQRVRATVDAERRAAIARNHTATHLLHRALERVLGGHAQQRGSLVAPDRLRFDFSHLRALQPDQLLRIEAIVNEMIRADAPVSWTTVGLDEARREGAKMLFGEKYGDRVRVVAVEAESMELCGGTHVRRTGEIGLFLIRSESSVGAGLRRIEALTGHGAEAHVRRELERLQHIATLVGASDGERLVERLQETVQLARDLERELEACRAEASRARADALAGQALVVDGVRVLATRVAARGGSDLRQQIDALRAQLGQAVIVLGAVVDDQPRVVVAVDDTLVARGLHAGRLVKELAAVMGGGGGGRPSLAEAGGRDPGRLDEALAGVPEAVRQALASAAGAAGATGASV